MFTLGPFISYPSRLDRTADTAELLCAFADAIPPNFRLPEMLRELAVSPDDVKLLFEIGYDLHEHNQFAMAATFLSRANELAPRTLPIAKELALTFERMMAPEEAVRVLEEAGFDKTDPMCAYLVGLNSTMCGRLEDLPQRVAALRDAPGSQNTQFWADQLESFWRRWSAIRERVPVHGLALTAWQAIVNGTVLLHESPYGYPDPMRGRYAFVQDSPELMQEGITMMASVLTAAGRVPRKVIAAPDRPSRILALAASKRLGLPVDEWSGSHYNALVVAWDLANIEDEGVVEALGHHRPGQVLWSHASNWVKPFQYSPDVTTLLCQEITHPWAGGALQLDPETNETNEASPDPRSDEELAEEILNAEPGVTSAASPGTVEAVLSATAPLPNEANLGVRKNRGQRPFQHLVSRISSARFVEY